MDTYCRFVLFYCAHVGALLWYCARSITNPYSRWIELEGQHFESKVEMHVRIAPQQNPVVFSEQPCDHSGTFSYIARHRTTWDIEMYPKLEISGVATAGNLAKSSFCDGAF